MHSLRSLLDGRVRRQGLELLTRYLQPGYCRGNDRSSQVPGEPQLSVCTCSNPTPAGLLALDHYSAATWPLVEQMQRLPRKVFRSSIAWLSDSLSTLRRTGYPATTQDSLPAAGQALPDGLSTRKVPLKGFRVVSLHLIPLSQALLGTMFTTDAGNCDLLSAFGGARRSQLAARARCRRCGGSPLERAVPLADKPPF